MTEIPFNEVDSICSISFTTVDNPRSLEAAIRCPISWADKPLYVQITLTTGILISGKISVAILSNANGVANNINIAITINV